MTVVLLKPQSLCPTNPTLPTERELSLGVPPGLLSPLNKDQLFLRQLLTKYAPMISMRPQQLYRAPLVSDDSAYTQESSAQVLCIQHQTSVRLRQAWTRQSNLLRSEHQVTMTIECTRRELKRILLCDEDGRIHMQEERTEHTISHSLVLLYRPVNKAPDGTPAQKLPTPPRAPATTAPALPGDRSPETPKTPPVPAMKPATIPERSPAVPGTQGNPLVVCFTFRERYRREYLQTLAEPNRRALYDQAHCQSISPPAASLGL